MKKNEVPTRANPRTNLEYTLNGEKPVKKDHIPFIGNVQNREIYRYRSLVAQKVKTPPAIQKTQVRSVGQEDPLEKKMAIQSSIPAWKIPRTRGAWQAISPWGHKESDITEQLVLIYLLRFLKPACM